MKKLAIATVVLVLAAAAVWFVWQRNRGTEISNVASSDISATPPAALADAQKNLVSASAALSELVNSSNPSGASAAEKSTKLTRVLDELDKAGATLPRDAFDAAAVVS